MLSDFVQRLLFVREFEVGTGTNEVIGTKQAIIPLNFLVDMQESDPDKFYLNMKSTIKKTFERIGKELQDETFKKAEQLYSLFGLGHLKIMDYDPENKKAWVKVCDTPTLKFYNTPNPSCSILRGVLAGMFSYLLKEDVDASINKCMARGADACEFIIKR